MSVIYLSVYLCSCISLSLSLSLIQPLIHTHTHTNSHTRRHIALLRNDFPTASRLIEQGLAIRETAFKGQENHPAIGSSLYLKARLLHVMGAYQESEKLFRQSLQVRWIFGCLQTMFPSLLTSLLNLYISHLAGGSS